MAKEVVERKGFSIRLTSDIFQVYQTYYRYNAKRNAENEGIARWLMRLTDNYHSWGFGLCYLYSHNVRGYGWNQKRIYQIYRELELNLRIQPRRCLVREKPEPPA